MRDERQNVFDTPSRETPGRDLGRRRHRSSRWLKASLRPSESPKDQKALSSGVMQPSDFPDGRVGRPCPSVASLLANPACASEIPVDQIPAVVAELASEQATLLAILAMLTTRLLTPDPPTADQSGDRLLTANEVAETLGVAKRWVQRRACRLPFARRLSAHAVRYSECGLKRWMANRQMRVA